MMSSLASLCMGRRERLHPLHWQVSSIYSMRRTSFVSWVVSQQEVLRLLLVSRGSNEVPAAA